jgi:predicted nucleotidyltransferase
MTELEKKIARYFRKKKEVIAVYLFGSHAEGRNRELSDIDIGILLDGDSLDVANEKRKEYAVALGRSTRKDIDAVILNSAGEGLLRQVFLKGKCIAVNDSRKLARSKMVMFAKIAEFGHHRSQMQSGLVRKIMEA